MNRARSINRINELFARFVAEVKVANANSLYDINIHSENILIPLLNLIYDLSLDNANSIKKNYPAVDLVDEKNRVAFQITATANSEKIKHTLSEFTKHEMAEKFDSLYVYILTDKQNSYSGKGFKEILGDTITFDKDSNIIDYSDLLNEINSIKNLDKLREIRGLLENEFTEERIQERKENLENPIKEVEEVEEIFPNLLEIYIPQKMYIAEISFDRKDVIERSKKTKKKLWWKTPQRQIASRVLNENSDVYCHDWFLYENKLITFRDLFDSDEPLRYLIDVGTIEGLDSEEFYQTNEDYNRAFKALLSYSLREKLDKKEVEWVHTEELFRFRANYHAPREKKVRWRKENHATKTVISEIKNKEKGHIICFKHLSFHYQIYDFANKWYISISPTWSFTRNGRWKSRFSKTYTSGIKRLENNKSVYYYFRFWAYFLNYYDLFDQQYPFFKTKAAFSFKFSPIVHDKEWKPISEKKEINPDDIHLMDFELTKTLFD